MSKYRRKLMMAYAANLGRGDIVYPGLIAAWSAKGKSNDDEDRATLRDLTGNGHDITLNGFAFNTEGSGYGNPDYPDALVFDGVDDYGICDTLPIQEDYTIIVKRIRTDTGSACVMAKSQATSQGSFVFEAYQKKETWSFGQNNLIQYNENNISYQTSMMYNGQNITKGPSIDTNVLCVGRYRLSTELYSRIIFYSAYLFDRSLDEQEIKSFIRKYIDAEYLLPSEIPTPDCYYDFSQGNNDDETRDTIKDLNGNGNDAVAHGFAWNEENSGYKDGALYFDGVDDYIDIGINQYKTIFMLMIVPNTQNVIYCSRYSLPISFYYGSNIAGNGYGGENGNYYLNGIRNTTILGNTLYDKKHLLTVSNEDAIKGNYYIGGDKAGNQWFANIRLYKFLGFKEALTEDQIQYVIKKYNLLDGVDEIEVS